MTGAKQYFFFLRGKSIFDIRWTIYSTSYACLIHFSTIFSISVDQFRITYLFLNTNNTRMAVSRNTYSIDCRRRRTEQEKRT